MSKLRERFSEMKENTPKRVQWLLMAAAFVVVLILLTLLLSGNDDDKASEAETIDTEVAELVVNPNMVNWADVTVGDEKKEEIKISVTGAPIKVTKVSVPEGKPDGLDYNLTCDKIGNITKALSCAIFVTYAPATVMPTQTVTMDVSWHDAEKTDDMTKTSHITLILGARAPEVVPEPIPEPIPEPTPEPEPIKEEIISEIEEIAPSLYVEEPEYVPEVESFVIPDGCSDFAFPAYGISGRQSGWIKPSAGVYNYHPFSDRDCSEPAGTYNPDNGIITDKFGKKIGTDADHIGFAAITGGEIPQLSNVPAIQVVNRARQLTSEELNSNMTDGSGGMGTLSEIGGAGSVVKPAMDTGVKKGSSAEGTVTSSQPYDRTFVLRQYKPIPATIVSDVRADIDALSLGVPVRATVDRNVYSDNGRTVVIPTGTLLLGYVTGEVPGPYKAIGRMNIKWYQFIRPDGVEFNFTKDQDPYSGDAQGRVGVPGRGSTDYMEQFIMPMLTAIVPAAVNLINPVADAFVNQIDLDNNTVVQSGMMRSSELAKNEIITAWNQVAQKLMVDMMDNTVPPFTIAAGTRITVYSPEDLQITCGDPEDTNIPGPKKKCAVAKFGDTHRRNIKDDIDLYPAQDDSWIGQVRSFQTEDYCVRDEKTNLWRVKAECSGKEDGKLNNCGGHSYSTLKMWCESLNYESKKDLQYKAYLADQSKQYQQKIENLGGEGSQQFNEEILGVQYNADGTVQNPYSTSSAPVEEAPSGTILCEGDIQPDANGCCPGEVYTDMGEQGFNCCPESGGDCFPPIAM